MRWSLGSGGELPFHPHEETGGLGLRNVVAYTILPLRSSGCRPPMRQGTLGGEGINLAIPSSKTSGKESED